MDCCSYTRLIALGFTLAFVSTAVAPGEPAGQQTGMEFLQKCAGGESVTQMVAEMKCHSYLLGMVDTYQLLTPWLEPKRRVICLPTEGIQAEQALLIVTKWLRHHPEQLHESVRLLALKAFMEAFPCR